MARPACSASLLSVVPMSSRFAISPLALHPGHYFVPTETPVLPKAISRQAIYRAFSGVPVHPRNRHLQKPGDLMHGQKLRVVFISVVHHCGPLLRNVRGQNTLRGHRAVGLERPHELLWARNRAQKWGRSSPIPCFVCAQIDRHAMRNFFCFGLFRKSKGELKGDGWGELCVSCTVHPQKIAFAQNRLREEAPESHFAREFSEPQRKSITCAFRKSEAPE